MIVLRDLDESEGNPAKMELIIPNMRNIYYIQNWMIWGLPP
jgi:hypothetical protein